MSTNEITYNKQIRTELSFILCANTTFLSYFHLFLHTLNKLTEKHQTNRNEHEMERRAGVEHEQTLSAGLINIILNCRKYEQIENHS